MGELFDKKISTALTDAYWIALEPFDDRACENAFKRLIATSKFFPRPADFIDLMVVKNVDMAEVEATKVLKAIKTLGAYQSVRFDDPVTTAVIQDSFGGWIRLCGDLTEAKESWFIKDFVRAYQAFAKQGITHDGQLAGIVERDNGAHGFEDKVPMALPATPPRRDLRLLVGKIGKAA
jgi:hypothetical protein